MAHYRIKSIKCNGTTGDSNAKLEIIEPKRYVFVAGMDYHDFWSFTNPYVDDRMKEILAAKKAEEGLIFYLIDVLAGTVIKIEHLGITPKKESITKYDKVDKTNYKDHRFSSSGKKIISKLDIYKLIEKIGTDNPNTLCELQIFSHAVNDGPILVDSNEYLDESRTMKNGDDHDMRISDLRNKIFDFTNFKKAFAINGIIKIWGCNNHPPFNNLIKQVLRNYRYQPDGTTSDDTKNNAKFYETYLGVQMGEQNYAVYDKPTINRLLTLSNS